MIPGTDPMLALQLVDVAQSAEVRLAAATSNRDATLRNAERAIGTIARLDASLRRLAAPPPARVLLVDDMPYVIDLFAQQIRHLTGCDVVVVSDAQRAMAEVMSGQYAAVVADLDLSHGSINGADLMVAAHGVRCRALYSGTPIDLSAYPIDPEHVTVIRKADSSDALARFCERVRRIVHPSHPVAPPSAAPSGVTA